MDRWRLITTWGADPAFNMGLDDPVAFVRDAGLPDAIAQLILAGNAEALLETRVRA